MKDLKADLSFWKKLNSPLGYIAMISLIISLIVAGSLVIKFNHPPGLINFNDGTNQGWTVDGFYDGAQPGIIQPAYNVAVWLNHVDISDKPKFNNPYDKKGSIGMVVGPGVPNSTLATSGWWRFDFISPDLSSKSEWQNIQGVEVYITDLSSLTGLTPLGVQILLYVKKPDGSTTFWVEKDSSGKPVIKTITPTRVWKRVKNEMPVPTGYTVLNIYIRVFGTAVTSNSNLVYSMDYIAIDAVSPL